jgi:hypothetical protein
MRSNNNLYGFINGEISSATAVNSSLNGLSTLNTLNIGNTCVAPTNVNNGLYGSISQPIIMSIAKYSLASFVSQPDLTLLNTTNVLFGITNNIDVITSTVITTNLNILNGLRYILNYVDSYDVSDGGVGPISGNFTSYINNVDFTFETWIYPYNYNTSYSNTVILDTRDPNNLVNESKCIFSITSAGYPQIERSGATWLRLPLETTTPIALNRWSHVVWMRKNNIFYTYVNGQSFTGVAVNTVFNSLTNMTTFLFGPADQIGTSKAYRFQGRLSQPIFKNFAVYTPSINFIPNFDLTPLINSSIVFYVNNKKDLVSNQTLSLINKTLTIQRYYLNSNFIIAQYNNNNYIDAYNFNNGWLGKEIKDFTSVFYGNNDFTVELWIYINYTNL